LQSRYLHSSGRVDGRSFCEAAFRRQWMFNSLFLMMNYLDVHNPQYPYGVNVIRNRKPH
jgi:hypothetical protein